MNSITTELVAALRERLKIIEDEVSRENPEQHTSRLQAVSEEIESLQLRLPKPREPQLEHFLQRRSYGKALEYLESADQT